MIVFVDLEHDLGFASEWGEQLMAARLRIKYRLEELAADDCLVVRYSKVSPELLERYGARAVFVSGNGTAPARYDPEDVMRLNEVLRSDARPLFGFCGGMQFLARARGSEVAPIGPLEPGEPDQVPWAPGRKFEAGYAPVRFVAAHPLLEGIDETASYRHAHGLELKHLPRGFSNLAQTKTTPIQLIVHDSHPVVGTQFHPEYWTDEHPEGRALIANFLRWSGIA